LLLQSPHSLELLLEDTDRPEVAQQKVAHRADAVGRRLPRLSLADGLRETAELELLTKQKEVIRIRCADLSG
jgi:hypothetical protein